MFDVIALLRINNDTVNKSLNCLLQPIYSKFLLPKGTPEIKKLETVSKSV